jgi:serine/threonine protein kinase
MLAALHVIFLISASDVQVLNGNPYNRKCDVYSYGICLWEVYCCDMPYADLSFSEVTSAVVRQVQICNSTMHVYMLNCELFEHLTNTTSNLQNLRPEIPRCCPSSFANVMKRCWDANPDKRPEMAEVVSMLEAIDTSKGGGMIPVDQPRGLGCLSCFRPHRGP